MGVYAAYSSHRISKPSLLLLVQVLVRVARVGDVDGPQMQQGPRPYALYSSDTTSPPTPTQIPAKWVQTTKCERPVFPIDELEAYTTFKTKLWVCGWVNQEIYTCYSFLSLFAFLSFLISIVSKYYSFYHHPFYNHFDLCTLRNINLFSHTSTSTSASTLSSINLEACIS